MRLPCVLLVLGCGLAHGCLPGFFPFQPPATTASTTSPSAASASVTSSSTSTSGDRVDQGLLSNATACGQKGHKGRVVGGAEAAEHEFPWHCALLNSRGKVGPYLVSLSALI